MMEFVYVVYIVQVLYVLFNARKATLAGVDAFVANL